MAYVIEKSLSEAILESICEYSCKTLTMHIILTILHFIYKLLVGVEIHENEKDLPGIVCSS